MKIKKKGETGFSSVDVVIAIGIIIVFASIIAVIYTNLDTINIRIERQQTATNYAIQVLEKVDELYYSEVTKERLESEVAVSSGYTLTVTVEKYSDTEGIDFDVVKTVYVTVSYKVSNQEESIQMKKIKTKEVLKSPNVPDLSSGKIPVKYVTTEETTKLVKTTKTDENWYSYENKKWALAVNKIDVNLDGSIKVNPTIYVWIPRFAYHITASKVDIKFLYANGKRYVNSDGNLDEITSGYTTPTDFEVDGTAVDGIWINKEQIPYYTSANTLNGGNGTTKYGPIAY